ncbi:MAG: hypothetical protein B6245_17740 [Desulfobacteraceae bacterium 4572_88]|nr:MAG: hypothetical protein B6245_17740 [Desulfobacteraceae bacterium 4572_88]
MNSEICFERARSLNDLVVIRHDPDGLHVAKSDYFDRLVSAYYAGNHPKARRFPHWEDDWCAACSREQFGSNAFRKQGRQYKKERWFEVKGKSTILPVRELSELQTLKQGHQLFPNSLYYQDSLPRSLYKTDAADQNIPEYFKGEIRLNRGKARPVHIYLHGFTSPAKWHFGVLKHMLGMKSFGGSKYDKKRWEAFEGNPVEDFEESVVSKCRTNISHKNMKATSCDERHCRKNKLFPQIHPFIKAYCHRYLRQAFTFFPQETEKTVKIWQGNPFNPNADPCIIEIKCRIDVQTTEIALKLGMNEEVERSETLILRGHSYDWTSQKEPTLHLCIITLYAGRIQGSIPPGHTRFRTGRVLGYGKLRTL